MRGLSTTGSISFGWAFVAGKNRVPSPAAGNTALRTLGIINHDFTRPIHEGQARPENSGILRASRTGLERILGGGLNPFSAIQTQFWLSLFPFLAFGAR